MSLFRRKRHKPASIDVDDLSLPTPFGQDGRLRLQCWFCEQEIEYAGFDPCAVILVTNWDEERKRREQQFFAHADCFRRSGSGADLYVFDEDFG